MSLSFPPVSPYMGRTKRAEHFLGATFVRPSSSAYDIQEPSKTEVEQCLVDWEANRTGDTSLQGALPCDTWRDGSCERAPPRNRGYD